MKECFESQDIQKLQETIKTMPEEDARYHMKRCVDSGLWKPAADDPDTNPEDGFRKRSSETEENQYEELPAKKEDWFYNLKKKHFLQPLT